MATQAPVILPEVTTPQSKGGQAVALPRSERHCGVRGLPEYFSNSFPKCSRHDISEKKWSPHSGPSTLSCSDLLWMPPNQNAGCGGLFLSSSPVGNRDVSSGERMRGTDFTDNKTEAKRNQRSAQDHMHLGKELQPLGPTTPRPAWSCRPASHRFWTFLNPSPSFVCNWLGTELTGFPGPSGNFHHCPGSPQ